MQMKNDEDIAVEQDWSPAVLAVNVGVSQQTINTIETRKYEPIFLLVLN